MSAELKVKVKIACINGFLLTEIKQKYHKNIKKIGVKTNSLFSSISNLFLIELY